MEIVGSNLQKSCKVTQSGASLVYVCWSQSGDGKNVVISAMTKRSFGLPTDNTFGNLEVARVVTFGDGEVVGGGSVIVEIQLSKRDGGGDGGFGLDFDLRSGENSFPQCFDGCHGNCGSVTKLLVLSSAGLEVGT